MKRRPGRHLVELSTFVQLSRDVLTTNVRNLANCTFALSYELAQPFGKYQPGTILLSGNRIPGDSSSTNIQLYASTDKG
jgi:hypothetical protein